VSIKVLFVFMALSAAALIGVAVTVFVRVRRQLKTHRAGSGKAEEAAGTDGRESLPSRPRR
jgi:hypothetical protein